MKFIAIFAVIATILLVIAFSNPAEGRFMEIEYTHDLGGNVIDYK